MRLGRPLAAASAVAAMTGASLIASPALANDSNRNSTSSPSSSSSPSPSGSSETSPTPSSSSSSSTETSSSSSFKITQEKTFVSASTNTSFTVSGTGCSGQQATVGIALYAPDGTASDVIKTEATSDGTWSKDLDLAALIKSIGSSTATTTDGWTIGASCMTYGGKTETAQTTTQQQTQIFFDDTRISGSYEVSARAENQSQTFTFNAQGFYASETVTVLLKNKSDSSIYYTLGELTVDANGNLVGNLPAPTDAANGEYVLVLTGSHHSETATSQTVTTVSERTFTIEGSQRSTSESETTENNGGGNANGGGKAQANGGGNANGGGEAQANGGGNANGGGEAQANGGGNANGGGEAQANGGANNQANGGANNQANGGNNNAAADQKVNNQVNRDNGDRDNGDRDNNGGKGKDNKAATDQRAGETKTGDSDRSLAHTGANGLIFGGIAALLVVIGGAVMLLRRRNKA